MQNPLEIRFSKLNKLEPDKGRLLISDPYLPDPSFRRAVVLLCEHNHKGSFGLILNKPLGISVNDALIDFPVFNAEVYMGGPVEPDKLFFIHTLGNILPESIPITHNLYWSGNFEALKSLIKKGEVTQHNIRFFIGYSGWDKGQLEKELKGDSWIISNADVSAVFESNGTILWRNILKKMGGQFAILADFPEDPTMN